MAPAEELRRNVRQVLKHPDTARCLQGAVMVAQQMMREQRKHSWTPAYQPHVDGAKAIAEFFASRWGLSQGRKSTAAASGMNGNANGEESGGESLQGGFAPIDVGQFEEINVKRKKMNVDPRAGLADDVEFSIDPTKQREAAVPASKLGRVFGFGKLGLGLAVGSVKEAVKQMTGGRREDGTVPKLEGESSSVPGDHEQKGSANLKLEGQGKSETTKSRAKSIVLSESNSDLIATTLCRMRGAALKLGQMLSIQDETVLPPQLSAALERVRQNADIMPSKQLEQVLEAELGKKWRDLFSRFNDRPFAAASLGQVHQALLKEGSIPVAVKVQFPGVAESIDSDLENLKRLANFTGIFPRGLFIDRIIQVMKQELKEECDYLAEARHQEKFRELLADDTESFFVPRVIEEASSKRVLTTELARGVPIDKVASSLSQEKRNSIGRKLLHLSLRELFEFRYMQTDPNFSNYLYDEKLDRIVLLDFGATREYGYKFVDDYIELVWAASRSDRSAILDYSIKLGFLTGNESQAMINAHIEAGLEVGRPFQRNAPFDFRGSRISSQMGEHGDTFMNERLTPPPQEVYSLHRKLSGAYMTCIRIGSIFPCQDLLEQSYEEYHRQKKMR